MLLSSSLQIVGYRYVVNPPITVKGKVMDEEGTPVVGVTVTVKGSKTMTATNANEEFTLYDIDDNVSLVFTILPSRSRN